MRERVQAVGGTVAVRSGDTGGTIVVATSGDTGGAAVDAFAGLDNVDLVVLFPNNPEVARFIALRSK